MYIVFGAFVFLMLVMILTSRARIIRIYSKYMKINNHAGVTGEQLAFAAKEILGYDDMDLSLIKGKLTDAYRAGKHKVLFLSEEVAHTASLSSVTIVAHEFGHAMQDHTNDNLFHFTRILNRITRFTNKLVFPLMIIGLLMLAFQKQFINWFEYDLTLPYGLIVAGAGLFFMGAVLKVVTIPMERDASRRALKFLKEYNIVSQSEYGKARRLLSVASQTYMASLFDGLLIHKLFIRRRKKR